jgi:hypothetical protein
MPRSDLWRWSATRVEIDHRARDARLGLERLERFLMLRVLPARSWLGRGFFGGGRDQGRTAKISSPREKSRPSCETPTEVRVAGGALAVAVKAA